MRDGFSAQALQLTSPDAPTTVGGGLSFATRAAITTVSMALAAVLAFVAHSPFGAIFFFPALAIAGVFGGVWLALGSFAVTVALVEVMLPGAPALLLDAGAALQTALALIGRAFFRVSRSWGVRQRRLLSSISNATTVLDGEANIKYPHPELARLTGMEWPDYAGRGWMRAVHPDDIAVVTPDGDSEVQRSEIRIKDAKTGEWHWYLMRAVPLFDNKGNVVEWVSALTDIHQIKLAQEQQNLVVAEARHRLKNFITIIESLAKSSRPANEPAVDEFMKKFSGRLHALSAASDLALASNYSAIDTEEIVRATLAPFLQSDANRLSFGGPKLALSEPTGGSLALGLHELATNAIKYGALSTPDGKVSFTWHSEPNGNDERVVMDWVESGKPSNGVTREGFGARVIKFIPSREKNGKVDIEYRPEGYAARISFTRPRTAATAN